MITYSYFNFDLELSLQVIGIITKFCSVDYIKLDNG